MDTPERPDAAPENLPYYPPPAPIAPTPSAPMPQTAAPAWDPYEASAAAEAEPQARPFRIKVVLNAMRRYWWQILLLWLAGSAGLVTLVHYLVKPLYEPTALIAVERTSRSLMAESFVGVKGSLEPFLNTQTLVAISPDVLGDAVQNPAVRGLPWAGRSLDPEGDLKKLLSVKVAKDTNAFTISMRSTDRVEGTTLVNAVVDSYLKVATSMAQQEIRSQEDRLTKQKEVYQKKVEEERKQLADLIKMRDGAAVQQIQGQPDMVTVERYQKFLEEHTTVMLQLVTEQAALDYLKNDLAERQRQVQAAAADGSLDDQVKQLFLQQPVVAGLRADIMAMRSEKARAERAMRNPQTDPTGRAIANELKRLETEYDNAWHELKPQLEMQVRQGLGGDGQQLVQARETEIRAKQLEITSLETRRSMLEKLIEEQKIQARQDGSLAFQIQMAQADYSRTNNMLEQIQRNLNQIEYDKQGSASFTVLSRAKPTASPTINNRTKAMAAAPLGVLALVVALFTLIEMKSGRVADPDELPTRLRLGVLGVVPPLPALGGPSRSLAKRGDDRRRVEEFVQSLDHLRVTLYANRPDGSRRRCVLITSAVGGEGKTTLAAQLAGRCANAGLLTVLVDADLRRPSLGELLEVPEGPGLSDVLAGEAEPESAMVVIGNAGGFHLLPAGAAGRDPSRLLHGERLGRLIEQLKATFDVVIVDAPPVLAVPDALLLGRWTDGAVLAVRHDSSRFPLVERAHRRLSAVGVPVLGAVVNGCRTMETNYGAYQYNPYAGRGAESDPA